MPHLPHRCKALAEELRTKFYWHRELTESDRELREQAISTITTMMKGFREAALSRLVESGASTHASP